MKKVLAIVERGKGKRNFACWSPENVDNCMLVGYGGTAREAMQDIKLTVQEEKEEKAEEGKTFPDVEFDFRFDVGSFFDYYPIDMTAFAKYIGMNASVLRQYATGIRVPKEETIKRIREGIDKLSRDLGLNLMIAQSPASYVD